MISSFGSGNTVIKSKLITRRMFILSTAKAIVFFGIFGRLVSLQINEATKYKTLSDKNRFREWKIAPQRGLIKDYFNQEIASNEKVYQLHITPENSPDLEKLFFRLKTILNLSDKRIAFLKRKMSKQKPWEPIIVSDNLTWSEFSRINLFLHELQGVEPIVSVARVYPDNSAAHIVGYVSEVSAKDLERKEYLRDMAVTGISVGKTGLEHKLDKDIIGKVGFQRYEVNAYGKRIKQIKLDTGQAGQDYRLTIDKEIQKFSTELLADKAASICVMDIFNGDIVTMASSPNYDPNAFVHGIDKAYWKQLISNDLKPLNNKAISGLYPPGSTIKTIVALSALENDVWNPKKYLSCTGVTELYGEKFHCWKKKGHGSINMRTAIQRSCDVYFYEVARLLGVDRLSETAKKFGLGKKVLKDFVEERAGVVPDTKWKKKFIGQNWYLGETLHSGIGQGYFLATPLQLANATSLLASGGSSGTPHLFLRSINRVNNEVLNFNYSENQHKIDIDTRSLHIVNESMWRVIYDKEIGTAAHLKRIEGLEFAGKTGTAQVYNLDKGKTGKKALQDHALFISFAPFESPEIVVSVIVDNGGSGSAVAAPIARDIINYYFETIKPRVAMQ